MTKLSRLEVVILGKTMLVLMISTGISVTLFGDFPDNIFGFLVLLVALYGHYKFSLGLENLKGGAK